MPGGEVPLLQRADSFEKVHQIPGQGEGCRSELPAE